MREIPIQDPIMHNASIRPDGRVIHDMYLYEVKTPAESKGEWDLSKLVATIPAQDAFQPLSASTCSLVRSEEHTSELQSRENLVCRLLLEKKKNRYQRTSYR